MLFSQQKICFRILIWTKFSKRKKLVLTSELPVQSGNPLQLITCRETSFFVDISVSQLPIGILFLHVLELIRITFKFHLCCSICLCFYVDVLIFLVKAKRCGMVCYFPWHNCVKLMGKYFPGKYCFFLSC